MLLRTLALLLVLGLAGCTSPRPSTQEDPTSTSAATPTATANPTATTAGDDDAALEGRRYLRASISCDDLLGYYIDIASELVGPWGLGGGVPFGVVVEEEAMADDSAESAAAPASPDGAGQAVSGTNIQELGVDEPDVLKSDGRIIAVVEDGQVKLVDVASAELASTVDLPDDAWHAELLLDGTTLLVLATGGAGGGVGPVPLEGEAAVVPAFPPTRTTVVRIDVSDAANPEVLGSVRMEGGYRSARMIDGTVRLVMVSQPTGLAFTQPEDSGLDAEQEALQRNREIIAESEIDDWVPHLQVLDPGGQAGETERILDCTAISQPRERAGLSTLSVLTFDLRGDELRPTSSAGLVAAGDTVYASTDRLVVTTSPWGQWIVPFIDRIGEPEELHTDLHSFDISDPAATDYVASATVEGTLINQFALSETGGILRVATTTQPDWFGGTGEPSQSSLVVFNEEDGALDEVGRLDGLGLTERIYAVRYLSPDLAAVVTFRQVDPLYLIDTSDPTAPALLGELKIPGFSSYLHPVGGDQLLGIGQDADPETGRTLGLQASLFDIADLSNPQRVAQITFGEGYSPVEGDHKAFLFWPPTGQAIVPAEVWQPFDEETGEGGGQAFAGALVLSVGDGTLVEQGRVSNTVEDVEGEGIAPERWVPAVQRSVIVGDDLWTWAHGTLARHDLASLAQEAWVSLQP